MGHQVDSLAALIEAFRSASTALISDNLDRLPGAVGLRPFHNYRRPMVGRALTVRTRAGDNRFIHLALDQLTPGDVIVVDGGGDESRALIGGIMMAIAASRSAEGFVIDGAIRDVGEIAASDLACFARSAIHRGPYKDGPGAIGVPVSVGGMIVNPGDLVVGDEDGVVAFPVEQAPQLLSAVQAQVEREAIIMRSILENRYVGVYAK